MSPIGQIQPAILKMIVIICVHTTHSDKVGFRRDDNDTPKGYFLPTSNGQGGEEG